MEAIAIPDRQNTLREVNPLDLRLTVVTPIFNEARTLSQSVERILAIGVIDELILVDDGSTDRSWAVLGEFAEREGIRRVRHTLNRGKGAALRTGFHEAEGGLVVIQDADLEYDPKDIPGLIQPILDGHAEVVFGSRFLQGRPAGIAGISYLANRVITRFFNLIFRQRLTDVETCYKVMRSDILQQVLPKLAEDHFGVEIELAARLSKIPGVRIVERPIQYTPRTRAEGKKIGWRDGVRALWCIVRYRFWG